MFNQVQYELIEQLISANDESISTAASLIVQNMIFSLTDLENKRKIKKPVNEPFEFSKSTDSLVAICNIGYPCLYPNTYPYLNPSTYSDTGIQIRVRVRIRIHARIRATSKSLI